MLPLAGAALLLTSAALVRAHGSVQASSPRIVADGISTTRLTWRGWRPGRVRFRIVSGARSASIERVLVENGAATAVLRAGIVPGPVLVEVNDGASSERVRIEAELDAADSAGDGTPDFLRLAGADERAFREWFSFLAEDQFFRGAGERPAEISDCAALLRFAYREALRHHDGNWATGLGLTRAPMAASVQKYEYPLTPLGASLFRVRAGGFRAADLHDGGFAEFADAQTLLRLNTHFVSRDLRWAQPGDLLFFHQRQQRSPFHAMVYLGRSHFDGPGEPVVVYHTGPEGKSRGEVRRPTLAQLKTHPEARWHPVPENPNFLGVYRWNILRAEAR